MVRNSLEFLKLYTRLAAYSFLTWYLMFLSIFVYFCQFVESFNSYLFEDTMQHSANRHYSDWWNSTGFRYFWKNWNVQTHLFLKEYVYLPLVCKNPKYRKASKHIANAFTFIVSAFFHELVFCCFTKRWDWYFFTAIT